MKKYRIYGFAALAALMLASCSEEQTAFTINDVPGRATISGDIVYNAGTSLQGGNFVYNYQPAADVEVFVTISNADYGTAGNGLQGESVFSTRTDEQGHYSIEVPTGANTTVNATIRTADFEGTMTTVVRDNNSIVTVEKPVVRWASESEAVRNHGIYYVNMVCGHREATVLPDSYTNYARIEGLFKSNVEVVEPFEAIRDEETNEIIGYEDAQRFFEWDGFGSCDLIVRVDYNNGLTATYNCTTDASGKYVLNVPVPEFPVSFSVNVVGMPKNGSFTTYEEVYVTRELSNGREVEVRSYIGHQIKGYYAMTNAGGLDSNFNFEMAGLTKICNFNGMIFTPFADEDTFGYSSWNW